MVAARIQRPRDFEQGAPAAFARMKLSSHGGLREIAIFVEV